jgi:hypothetical protein
MESQFNLKEVAMKKSALLAFVILALTAGCATMQRIHVDTDPPGAEINLQKSGTISVSGHAPSVIYGSAEMETFEEPPIVLGKSPVSYEFPLNEKEAGGHVPGVVYVDKERKVKKGMIRAELGGVIAEKHVEFTGDPIEIKLKIDPGTDK